MALFQSLVDGLRKAERELEAQLAGVKAAISSLSEGGGLVANDRKRGRPPGSKNKRKGATKAIIIHGRKRKRRKLSAAARKAISDAQKARWAKQKAGAKRKRPALNE
jgi:hypothetical protein